MINKILIGISILCLSLGFIGCSNASPAVKESKVENNKSTTDTTNTEDKIKDEETKKLQDELKQLQDDLEKLENQLDSQDDIENTPPEETISPTRYNSLYTATRLDDNTTTIYTNTSNINAAETGSIVFNSNGENVGILTIGSNGNVIQVIAHMGNSPESLIDLNYTVHGDLTGCSTDVVIGLMYTVINGTQWSERTVG